MQLIQELERTRDETLQCFSLDERDLARTYAPGKWSVRFLLHHLVAAHNEHHLGQIRSALQNRS